MKDARGDKTLAGTRIFFALASACIVLIAAASVAYFSYVMHVADFNDSQDVLVVKEALARIWLIAFLAVLAVEATLYLVYSRFIKLQKQVLRHASELEESVKERTGQLQDALDRFKSVMDSTPVAIFSTDKNGILRLREGRGGARAGVKPGQGVGESYFEQFKDVPQHLGNVRRALRGEEVTDRLQVRDGYYQIVYSPILKPDGTVDGMIGVATDITDLKQAEREAAVSNERLESVLQWAPIAVLTTDKDGIITMRKGMGGKRAGVAPDTGIGHSFFEEYKDVPRHAENVRRALRGEVFTDRLAVRSGFSRSPTPRS